ncbi:MAG TPA: hypothetical protein VIM41_14975 [Gammaproteobacteria bacterium]
MKNLTAAVLVSMSCMAVLSITSSQVVFAMQDLKAQMETAVKDMCKDQNALSCLESSLQTCSRAVDTALDKCAHLFPNGSLHGVDDWALTSHGRCMENILPKLLNVEAGKIDACMQLASEHPVDPNAQPLNSAMPDAQKIHQELPQAAQHLNTDGVTLPIYKNATLMQHIDDEQNLNKLVPQYGVKPLPALTLASTDSIEQIALYYRKTLSDFKEYKFNSAILFLEKGPEDFNLNRDLKLYASTPRVVIEDIGDGERIPPGAQSKIEISYRK